MSGLYDFHHFLRFVYCFFLTTKISDSVFTAHVKDYAVDVNKKTQFTEFIDTMQVKYLTYLVNYRFKITASLKRSKAILKNSMRAFVLDIARWYL